MVSTKTLNMMRRMSGAGAQNSSAANETNVVDFSGETPVGTPMVQTDFGDLIPAETPGPEPIAWAESLTQGFPEKLGETYDGGETGIFKPQPGIPEAVRQIGRKDILQYRIQDFQTNENDEKARERLKTVWFDPCYQEARESLRSSGQTVDKAIEEWEKAYKQREPEWQTQAAENARASAARGNDWTDHNRFMAGFPETGYVGRTIAESGHRYKPKEQADYDYARYFLDWARHYTGTYSKLEEAINSEPAPLTEGDIAGAGFSGYLRKLYKPTSDAKSSFDQFLHGISPRSTEDFLSFGWAETVHLNRLNDINAKAARGEELTDGEKALAEAYLISLDAQAGLQRFGGATTAEKMGQFIGENIPFLLEMAATGGLGGAAGGAVRGLARKGIVKGIQMAGKSGVKGAIGATLKNGVGRYVAKQGTNIAGSLVGGMAMAPFSQAIYRNNEYRDNDQYDVGLDAEGNYTAELARPTSWLERAGKSGLSAGVEAGSELWGGWAGVGRLFPQWLRKTKVGEALEPLRRFGQTLGGRKFDKYVGDTFRWNGILMEGMEEELSNALEPILTGEAWRLKENFSPEAQFDTMLGVLSMGTAMHAVRTPMVAYDHVRSARRGGELLSKITKPEFRQQLRTTMSSGTRQEQAQKLGRLNWQELSMQDRAAAMEYVAHRVEGRVTQDLQEAMWEQEAARQATQQFEQYKNRDTGNLETVTDAQGTRFYLAGGTLEATDGNGIADGTVFVIDPATGETSQRSLSELARSETMSPEQYETKFQQYLEQVAQAEAETKAMQEIYEEAAAAGEDPTPAIAAYKGVDLDNLAGQTVTMADGTQVYVSRVYNDGRELRIDALPLDQTGEIMVDNDGNEVHVDLDVSQISSHTASSASVDGVQAGTQTEVVPQSAAADLRAGQRVTLADGTQALVEEQRQADGSIRLVGVVEDAVDDATIVELDPAQVVAIDGKPVAEQTIAQTAQEETTGAAAQSDPYTDIQPVGRGAFGNIYNQFRGKAREAIDFLLRRQEGEAVGALHHPQVGDIDLVWGKEGTAYSDGYGLSKIAKYHPEVLTNLQEVISGMNITKASGNRLQLESRSHAASVRLDWNGEKKTWLLTAFEKETPTPLDRTTDVGENLRDLQNDTAPLQSDGVSEKSSSESGGTSLNKTTTSVPNVQEEEQNIPRKKDGTTDYDRIDDPAVAASALREEFGEEALAVAQETLDEARQELEKAARIPKAIDRKRAQKHAAAEVAKWEQTLAALTPALETGTEETAVDTQSDETTQKSEQAAGPIEEVADPVREAATPTEKLRAVGQIVAEMNRTSGAKAYVFNNVDELPEELRRRLDEEFERDGITWRCESYICAPQMQDTEQTRRTYIHEIGGHQNIEHAIATAAEKTALWEAIVDDIGLDGLRAWGIEELNGEIAYYEAGELAKWHLGREALAYATELNADLSYFTREKPLSLTVDLNQRITPETIRAILETANRYDDQRPRINIASLQRERLQGYSSSMAGKPAGRGHGETDGLLPQHSDAGGDGVDETQTRRDAAGHGIQTGQTDNPGIVSGQNERGADRAEPGALPAGETVTDEAGTETGNEDIRYRRARSAEDSRTLIAVHNTTEEQLKKSLSLGGFPMPSIAIAHAGTGHTEFGEISLLFDKNTIDPSDRRNRVYGGDAWTPVFPRLGVKIDFKALETASAEIHSLLGEELCDRYNVGTELKPYNVEVKLERNNGDVLAAFAGNDWMKQAYLRSKGEDFAGGWGDLYNKVPTDDKSYREWVANIFSGLVEKIGLRNDKDMFTPIGNRRKWETLHDEVTLDNVVKAMKKQAAKGGESIFGGNIFGSAQEEYKSLAAIRKAAGERLREMTKEESDQIRNDITNRLSGIDIPTQDKGFGAAIDMVANITEAVKHARTPKGIYAYLKTLYPDMTMEIADEIAGIVKDIQKMSVRYFEAKPYRAVGFDEVRLAVVPSDTDMELVRQLERRHIPVRVYERGNEQQRRALVTDATAELDIRFRQREAASLSLEEINERFNAELRQQIEGTLPEGHVYRLGMPSEALRAAGVPNLPIELAASRLAEKASPEYASNHPFKLDEVENLPQALQNPIAVFDSKTQLNSKVILTELQSNGNNFVVAIKAGTKRISGRRVLEINSVRSVYPKDYAQDVVNWINRGDLLRWADNEKALDWLGKQQSNSADVAIPVKGLDVSANIIKNFANPTLRDGEKVSAADRLADELGVRVRVVRDAAEIGDTEPDARRKRGSYGWYGRSTGEIAVVLPNCADAAEVQETILHEAVGHYGIPQLLGRERADEFYRRVFDAVRDTRRGRELLAEHGSETVAGDEYLAEMAEGNVTPSVFRRMIAAVRAFFRDVLGIDLKLTDADLRYILWRSRHNLQRARTVGEAMETIEQDIRMRAQTARESARERKAERLEKLRRSEPLVFTGDEYKGKYELNSKSAGQYIVDHLRGTYTNADTGETIYVSRKSQKAVHHDAESKVHLQSVAYIPQMLKQAIYIDESVNEKSNAKFDSYRYYVCGLKIDGVDYTAKLVIGRKDGQIYYDHALTQIEKGDLINQRDLVKAQVYDDKVADGATGTPVSTVKDKRLISVLQAEPLAYQIEADNRSAKSEPKTVMEYLDRVAEEAAEREASETRFRKKSKPGPNDPIRTTRGNFVSKAATKLQDATIPVRQLQEWVIKHEGKVGIENDLYTAMNRAPGRATERIKRVDEQKFIPLAGTMRKIGRQLDRKYDADGNKISRYKQISDYVAAKSAQERHRSGIAAYSEDPSNPWNKDYVETLIREFEETVDNALIDELWSQIRDIANQQLEMSKNYGLIDTQTYRDIKARGWRYYVPLQGIDAEFEGLTDPHDAFGDILAGKKGSGESEIFHKAKGHITKPEDVLGTLQRNVHRTILAGERNAARQFLLRLVDANPELQGDPRDGKHIFRIESRWFVRNPNDGQFDEMTMRPSDEAIAASNEARRRKKKLESELRALKPSQDPSIPENDRLAEYLDKRKELADRIEAESQNITVTTRPMEAGAYRGLTEAEEQAHTVTVRKNGVRYVVRLSDPTVANAINNNFEEFIGGRVGKLVDFMGKGTRVIASLSTSWNPEFIIPNNLRDAIWAGVYNAVDSDGNFKGYIRNIPNSYASISRYHTGHSTPLTLNERAKYDIYTPEGARMAQQEFGTKRVMDSYYDDFLMEGGLTGYAYMHDVKDYSKKLARKIKANAKIAGRTLGILQEAAEFMGDMSEISTRFATFLSQVQMGRDVREAVNYAKNITINFNTRGEWGRGLNSLFMFYNASMQGVANVYRLTKRNPGRMSVAIATMMGLGYGMSLLLSQFLAAGGGDGEEWNISDYERYTNFILPGSWFGDKDGYIKIPIPMELRPFWISGVVTNDLNQGKIKAEDAWKTVLQASSDAFSPLEISADHPGKIVTPTLLKPLFEIGVWNTDFAGRQINRTPFTKAQEGLIPDSRLGQRNASIISKGVTEWLNELGGGSEWTPAGTRKDGSVNKLQNLLDISPSTLDHLAASYTGGVGRMLLRTFNFITKSGDERSARNWPIFNRFYGEVRKEVNPSTRYYDLRAKYQSRRDLFRNNAKNGTYPSYYSSEQEAKADYANIKAVLNKMKPYDKALSRMKQGLDGVEYGSEEYKRITKAMNQVKSDFIKEYDHAFED